MKTVVVLSGWKKIEKPSIVFEALDFLIEDKSQLHIAHRSGPEFDALITKWAKQNGVKETLYKARKIDRRAGIQQAGSMLIRRIIEEQNPDCCLVFVDSKRSATTLAGAVRLLGSGRVYRVDPDGKIRVMHHPREPKNRDNTMGVESRK